MLEHNPTSPTNSNVPLGLDPDNAISIPKTRIYHSSRRISHDRKFLPLHQHVICHKTCDAARSENAMEFSTHVLHHAQIVVVVSEQVRIVKWGIVVWRTRDHEMY